ncbi:PE-PPE domain-containing protein [Mycolicibacterium wolinskyi]|uniref:PE-PPE domain-containing protein n=1 Tax=Mycolicibacterium wolinskyi TaxID=59750 RepID=UPI001F38C789|nr:PE-PPE domain-containing protein [Mycolicibacterium wolinskyi]
MRTVRSLPERGGHREEVDTMVRALRSLGLAVLAMVGVVALAISASMSTVVQLVLNQPHALVIGGNTNPDPSPEYVDNMVDNYIGVGFPDQYRYPVHTPQQFWPVNGTMTFDQSTAQGVADLEAEMAKPEHQGVPLVILGYSSSTRLVSAEKNKLIAAQDFERDISFVLVSDVNKGNGGVLARFPGWEIPLLGVTFDGATRTDSPQVGPDDYALDTKSITIVHDGWSDFPIYPLNGLALANGIAGIVLLHGTYPELDQPELVPVGRTGDTEYFVIETEIVPLLMPLEQIGVPRPILLAVDEPVRVLIEAGYRRDIDPGAPTPAYLVPVINPVSLTTNFVAAIPVGIDDGLQASDLGRPLGTTPSGPFGVGGEDEDLEGAPPGFIPLGNPAAATTTTTTTSNDSTTTSAAPAAEPAADTDDPPEPKKSERPKPVRPKVRGPISFDGPKLSVSRPLKRVVNALIGGQSETADQTSQPEPASDPEPGAQAGADAAE